MLSSTVQETGQDPTDPYQSKTSSKTKPNIIADLHLRLNDPNSGRTRESSGSSYTELDLGVAPIEPLGSLDLSIDFGSRSSRQSSMESIDDGAARMLFPRGSYRSQDSGRRTPSGRPNSSRNSLNRMMTWNSGKHFQNWAEDEERESVLHLSPVEKLEMVMVEIKKSGHPVREIFQVFESQAQDDQISLEKWIDGLKNLHRGVHFPLSQNECTSLAQTLFYYNKEGCVHVKLFKDWCYDIRDLCWRAESKRRSSTKFQPVLASPIDVTVPHLEFGSGQDLLGEEGLTAEDLPVQDEKLINIIPSKRTSCPGKVESLEIQEEAHYGEEIYRGTKLLWRTHETLDIKMYENTEHDCISIIAHDAETSQAHPTLRVNTTKIPLSKDEIEKRAWKRMVEEKDLGVPSRTPIQTPSRSGSSRSLLSARNTPRDLKSPRKWGVQVNQPVLGEEVLERARRDLLIEYLLQRFSMPSKQKKSQPPPYDNSYKFSHLPPPMSSRQPVISKFAGDTWDTLQLVTPVRIGSPPRHELTHRRSQKGDFDKALMEVQSARQELRKFKDSAKSATSAFNSSMRVLEDLSRLANASHAVNYNSPNWARTKWCLAYRRVRARITCDLIRARLRTMPQYKEYMRRLDKRTHNKNIHNLIAKQKMDGRDRGLQTVSLQRSHTSENSLNRRYNNSPVNYAARKESSRKDTSRKDTSRKENSSSRLRQAGEQALTSFPPLGTPR